MLSLIFDLDDTLYSQATPFYAAVEQMDYHPPSLSLPTLQQHFQVASEATYVLHDRGQLSLLEMRQTRIQQAYAQVGVRLTAKEARRWQDAYEVAQGEIQLSETIVRLLDQCQEQDVQLGLITNGPSDHQRRKIKALELARWFPASQILVSGDLGISKPDPRIFHHLAAQLPKKTASYYYIGDNPQNDMQGALAVGWQGIWLDCKGETMAPHPAVTPVHSHVELAKVVTELLAAAT